MSLHVVPGSEQLHGIGRHARRGWHVGQKPAIRSAEAKRAVGLAIELIAFLVDGAVVPATEKGEVRERGGATLCPVPDMMPLAERQSAAREAAAAVSMVKSPPERRGNRPGLGGDLHDAAVLGVLHQHPARVARLGCTPKVRHEN